MLLSKLTSGAAKSLMRPEEVLLLGLRSATVGGPLYLNLVLYPERVID
jgi:hypothetical protein